MRLIHYDAAELTPEVWRNGGAARAFNPTITEVDGGYAIAYRVVQVDSDHRRIATARLDQDLVLVPGSVTPLSDEIVFQDTDLPSRAATWHADPVYARLGGRLYLLWNDGGARPANHQFLAEMSPDGQRLAAPARELTTIDRRDIEKNWTLFDVDGEIFATYSYRPHRVLRVDLDSAGPVIVATPAFTSGFDSGYEKMFGIIRGGSQPVRVGERFVTMAHSSYKLPEGRVYRGALVEFEAAAPFRIRRMSNAPFDLPSHIGAGFEHQKLNPDVHEVVYPRGLVRRGESEWIVSYGLNDEECAIAVVPSEHLMAGFGPEIRTTHSQVESSTPLTAVAQDPRPQSSDTPELPVFWFDAKGKLFDGFYGGRRFTTGNFGDIASAWAAKRLSGTPTRTPLPGEPRLLAIGSVLQRAQQGDVVWGSGVKGGSDPLPNGIDLDVRAVRGPLSIEYLEQAGVSTARVKHLFDPGVLFPRLFAADLAKAGSRPGDRIIPHYHDDLYLRRRHYEHIDSFVSVDTTPLGMMKAIKGADRVFASSLHGVIFAEAMGIPAYWLAPVGGEDELKYYDYYYGTGRTAVKRFTSLEEAMASDPMPLPEFDIDGYLETFPHDALERLATRAVRPGQRFDFKEWSGQRLDRSFSLSGFAARDRGVWMTSLRGAVSGVVRATPGEELEVTFAFAPVKQKSQRLPVTLLAQANGGPVQAVRWSEDGADRVELTLRFTALAEETPLRIDLVMERPDQPSHAFRLSRSGARDTARYLKRAVTRSRVGGPPARFGQLLALRVASRARRA